MGVNLLIPRNRNDDAGARYPYRLRELISVSRRFAIIIPPTFGQAEEWKRETTVFLSTVFVTNRCHVRGPRASYEEGVISLRNERKVQGPAYLFLAGNDTPIVS